jgi:uncharacterized membrane protein YjjB (DUF3815 family)
MTKTKLIDTVRRTLISLIPLILLILIFEGTLKTYAWIAMLLWMGYYTYIGVKTLYDNGSIALLSSQLRRKNKNGKNNYR